MAVLREAYVYSTGLPGMELASSCLGEKKAPGSCWIVVGMRQRSAKRKPGGVCSFFESPAVYLGGSPFF